MKAMAGSPDTCRDARYRDGVLYGLAALVARRRAAELLDQFGLADASPIVA
jgi:hypothetical protein